MMLVFDATAGKCAVAIFLDGQVKAARSDDMARGHAERLFPLIDECLGEVGAAYGDLIAIAVCTGPGNFTGARIGVAAARGLAVSLLIPAIGVDRFDAAALDQPGDICVRLEARGGAAHLAQYRDGVLQGAAETLQADDIAAFIGDARAVVADIADLASIAKVAQNRLDAGETDRPAPRYLRPANAALPSTPPPAII